MMDWTAISYSSGQRIWVIVLRRSGLEIRLLRALGVRVSTAFAGGDAAKVGQLLHKGREGPSSTGSAWGFVSTVRPRCRAMSTSECSGKIPHVGHRVGGVKHLRKTGKSD